MNRKFMILSSEKVAIIDENGDILKIVDNNDDVQEILRLMIKMEITDDKLKDLKFTIQEQKDIGNLSKNMLKIQPFLILVVTIGGFVLGGLFSNSNFVTYGISSLIYSLIIAGVATVFFEITRHMSNKKVKQFENEIIKIQSLKKNYEQELLEVKVKQLNNTLTINNSTTLVEQTNYIRSQIDENLNTGYEEYSKNGSKKLTLRKRK